MTSGKENVEVTFRNNDGEDKSIANVEKSNALSVVDALKVPDNHMICIVENGMRTKRWDRERLVGENTWGEVDPHEFEVLGKIRSVVRVVEQPDLLGDPIHPNNLLCYQVGDFDWFAATSPEEALKLMQELIGGDVDHPVSLCSQETLDERWRDEEKPDEDVGSLREWLAEATEPGWLAGTEG